MTPVSLWRDFRFIHLRPNPIVYCWKMRHIRRTIIEVLQYMSWFRNRTSHTGTELEELRSTYIANCVFNSFLSYTSIMLNIVTIHAIRKVSSLPKALITLLLSIAVSDVSVGLFGQPFYISLVVETLQQNNPGCIINLSSFYIHCKCVFLSLFPWCCSRKCWQILGNSSSSQVPGIRLTSVLLWWWSHYGFLVDFFLWQCYGTKITSYLLN